MNENRSWRDLNRLLKQAAPVVGSPEWWAQIYANATEIDGTLNINKLDACDPAWLEKNPRGEIDLDGDGGAEWLANQADNKNRRAG